VALGGNEGCERDENLKERRCRYIADGRLVEGGVQERVYCEPQLYGIKEQKKKTAIVWGSYTQYALYTLYILYVYVVCT